MAAGGDPWDCEKSICRNRATMEGWAKLPGCSAHISERLSLGPGLSLGLSISLGLTLGLSLGQSLGLSLGDSLWLSLGLSLGLGLSLCSGLGLGLGTQPCEVGAPYRRHRPVTPSK